MPDKHHLVAASVSQGVHRKPGGHRKPVEATGSVPALWSARLVLGAYVAVSATPFVIAATQHAFWEHEHDMAPVVTLLFAGLLVALVRRHRWAWLVLVVLDGALLVSFAFDFTSVGAFLRVLAGFALVCSPQMRRYVQGGRATITSPPAQGAGEPLRRA
jgi:hypothetical protein